MDFERRHNVKYIDLHTHSLNSDGTMTPSEVVAAAKAADLAAIALSDHDTVAGVKEAMAAGEALGVEVVPAIELSARSETETHILGYFIDPDSPALLEKTEYIKKVRILRQENVCRNLQALGFDVTMEEIREIAGSDVLCRAHFAKIMVKKGYAASVKDAFDRYLSVGKPAYSDTQALTDVEAVRLIKDAGGLAFVAHLHQTKRSPESLEAFLRRLKEVGLDGVEGYYTEYTPEMGREYRALAEKLGLLLSGGSDFHADNKPHIAIGRGLGDLRVPYSLLTEMKRKL